MNKIGKFIAKLTKKEKKIQSLMPGSKWEIQLQAADIES